MGLRLGFHYHVPAVRQDGGIFMPGFQGRFVDSLAAHCQEVICFLHTPRPDEQELMDYRILRANVTLVDIGQHVSVPRRMIWARRLVQPLKDRRGKLDALLIRGPSPLLASLARVSDPVPVVLLLVGDLLSGIDDLPQPRWRKEAIRLWARWNHRQQLRVASRSLVFVNSRQLYNQLRSILPELHEIRTTTLETSDFYRREDTCLTPPIHLLYTGRIDRGKGLLNMLEALSLLVNQGEDIVLDLVGWPHKNDNIIEQIQALAQQQGVAQRVIYHGYKALGHELFAYYKQADIYVICSLSSFEGFPRTIWEAMAHSLPVVATRVGSIPDFIQGAAELIEPGKVQELAAALSGLIHDPKRRRLLIQRGFTLAADNTMDKQVGNMITQINNWLEK
jgi:glycosyltransferase involved in cell wall biosynthesis